tara:strand:- start:573 stop:701 length:129 start_codon:yes stop_codon:yes gene_type:complete
MEFIKNMSSKKIDLIRYGYQPEFKISECIDEAMDWYVSSLIK